MDISNQTIDFGTVYQADGKIPLIISYTNRGKSKLILNRIVATGLLVREVDRKGAAYMENGEIKIELDPIQFEGLFDRKIILFSNAQNSPQEVSVSGRIISGSNTSKFKYKIGGMGFKQSQMNFGYIYKGDEVIRYIPVYNFTDEALTLNLSDYPEYLRIAPLFDSLFPYENGMLEVSFNTNICNDWDFIIDKVNLEIGGRIKEKGWITFTANIRENFEYLTPDELENLPVAEIPVKIFDFDTIPKQKTVKHNYLLINSGKSVLNIRALKPTCGCTAALSNSNIIQPGDSTYIHVEFDATGYTGRTKQGVSVITNDPENYKQFLWITGYVK